MKFINKSFQYKLASLFVKVFIHVGILSGQKFSTFSNNIKSRKQIF